MVNQLQQVASSIVGIGLMVCCHCLRICNLARPLIGTPGFPSRGTDQLVEAVVDIMADRFNTLVGKEADRQRLVLDTQDIASGVVDIIQVLQGLRLSQAGVQTHQPAISRVVFESADHTVACGFLRDLALGVVIHAVHQHLISSPIETQPSATQQPVHGVVKLPFVALAINQGHNVSLGIETHLRGGSRLRLKQAIALAQRLRPVRRLQRLHKMLALFQPLALDAEVLEVAGACRVIATNQLPIAVINSRGLICSTIKITRNTGLAGIERLLKYSHRA